MSRTKDSRWSKKRKLSDTEATESAPSPKKAQIVESGSTDGALDRDSGVALDTALSVKGEGVKAGSKQKARKNGLIKEDNGGGLLDQGDAATTSQPGEAPISRDGMDAETVAAELQSKSKDKAASRQAKSERRSRKQKKRLDTELGGTESAPAAIEASTPLEPAESTSYDQPSNSNNHPPPPSTTIPSAKPTEKPTDKPTDKEKGKQRFIVFIGNLPYRATTSSIRAHFSKLLPFTVRHSTDKATGRSRGFAFLEFESYDRMKTCLRGYHHSVFEPPAGNGDGGGGGEGEGDGRRGRKSQSQARKINVELTAGGGGGKSGVRKERIRGKNEKLGDERERARVQKLKDEAAGGGMRDKEKKTGANAMEVTSADGEENIHPSRRKRVTIT